MQNGRESSTSAVVEPSSTESLSSQTDESITSRYQTSVDDSESSSTLSKFDEVVTTIPSELLSSHLEQQGTSKAGKQYTDHCFFNCKEFSPVTHNITLFPETEGGFVS